MATIPNAVIKAAQNTEQKYGVPASITIAQWALESAYGTSNVARNANNFFGIKVGSWTGATYGKYRAYNSMQESFDDHGKLLAKPLYADKTKNATNAEEYIKAIAETYAPTSDGNVNYAGQIMTIINKHNLTQYDSGKYGGSGVTVAGDTVTVTDTTSGNVSAFGVDVNGILSGIVKVVSVIALVILAVVLFCSAFDLKIGGGIFG